EVYTEDERFRRFRRFVRFFAPGGDPGMSEPGVSGSRQAKSAAGPYHIRHATFEQADAEQLYGPASAPAEDESATHMADETTRDFARRMHYAAWRAAQAASEKSRQRWRAAHLHFR